MDDPRRIHEAKRQVQARFAGKPLEEVALAAAVNTELLLDQSAVHEARIQSLENWRLILVGGLIVVTAVVVPLFIRVVGGGA